jgi:hypothetical protein
MQNGDTVSGYIILFILFIATPLIALHVGNIQASARKSVKDDTADTFDVAIAAVTARNYLKGIFYLLIMIVLELGTMYGAMIHRYG